MIHIRQHLIVRGKSRDVQTVMNHIKGIPSTDNACLDLNRIVPMPPAVKSTAELVDLDIFIEHYEQNEFNAHCQQLAEAEALCTAQTGFAGWRDWCLAHWGSSGNAYWIKPVKWTTNELIFHTSSAPIFAALQVLSAAFTEVVVELEHIDTVRKVVGRALFSDGDGCDERLDWEALEAKALRYRLIGESDDPNNQNLVIKAVGVH